MDAKTLRLIREKEFRLCALSFPYFFENHWKIILPKENKFGLPEARAEQLATAQSFQDERRVVVLKARQIGWTTLVTSYAFWKAWFHGYQQCLVLSRREDPEALLIIQAIKLGYGGLEPWMRERGPKVRKDTLTKLMFDNESSIESDASKDNPARGRTLQLLILDEFGRFPDPEGAWGSALPATEYGQLIVIGNADRRFSRFHTLYTEGKAKINDFVSLFFSWRVVPGRDEAWLAKETSSMTAAQRAAEYPNNDEECWVSAGSPVFEQSAIAAKVPHVGVSGALVRSLDSARVEFHHAEEDDGFLRIWAPPVPGGVYGMGVDTARGLEHGDRSASVVVDHNYRVCATLWGPIAPVALATLSAELAKFYNNALMGVEDNNVGSTTLDHLIQVIRYRNLYARENLNAIEMTAARKFGWHTDDRTKPLMINHLAAKLPEMDIIDAHILDELSGFRYLGDGKMGGSPHDDLVMALAIACQMARRLRAPQSLPEMPEPPKVISKWEGFDGTIAAHARLDLPEEPGRVQEMVVIGGRRRSWKDGYS